MLDELDVDISKALTMARQPLNLIELRVTRAESSRLVQFSAVEYAAMFGTHVSGAYEDLKGVSTSLWARSVSFADGTSVRWVEHIEYRERHGFLEIRFSPEITAHITRPAA
jgi:plasmid replication initiation protein